MGERDDLDQSGHPLCDVRSPRNYRASCDDQRRHPHIDLGNKGVAYFPIDHRAHISLGYAGRACCSGLPPGRYCGLQLLYGDISALGDLLIPSPHQGFANKLAIELQRTAYYACFFVFGSVLAARLREIRFFFSRRGSWLGFVLLGAGLLVFQGHWSHWHAIQELMVAVGSVLILCSALAPGGVEKMLLKRFPRYLGRLSFSLYLVHVPIILTLTILTHGTLSLPLLILTVVPVSIALADAFDHVVTAPSANLGHRLTRASRNSRRAPQPVLQEEQV